MQPDPPHSAVVTRPKGPPLPTTVATQTCPIRRSRPRAPAVRAGRRLACWLSLQLISLTALLPLALAQSDSDDATRAAARSLGAQGIEAYWANDFSTANDKLDRAFRVYPTTTLGLWSARARLQLGQLVEAAERLREAIRADVVGDAETQQKAQQEARDELDQLMPRIPTLTIHIHNAPADQVVVTLDNEPIPSPLLDEARPTNPGELVVVATRGNERYERRVYLGEGDKKQTTIEFRREARAQTLTAADGGDVVTLDSEAGAPPSTARARARTTSTSQSEPASSPLAPIGIVTLAFGSASLATAGITALIANGKLRECPENSCPPDVKEQYDGLRTVSTIAFYAGAALALSGAILWLVAPGAEEPASAQGVSLGVGPTGLALAGSF